MIKTLNFKNLLVHMKIEDYIYENRFKNFKILNYKVKTMKKKILIKINNNKAACEIKLINFLI